MYLCKGIGLMCAQFLLLLMIFSKASCNLPNYFATNNYYNTPQGPVYWDEYRLFGYGNRIGAYGYRYGTANQRVEVNFHRPSVSGPINSPYNPVFQSPPVWPPFTGSNFKPTPPGNGYGTPPGFPPGYPGGFQSAPWRPVKRPQGYDYLWPRQWRSSDDGEEEDETLYLS